MDKSSQKPEGETSISLRIPASIAKDLRVKAALADKTQREIILEGLKRMGIEISDEQISDRRKVGSANHQKEVVLPKDSQEINTVVTEEKNLSQKPGEQIKSSLKKTNRQSQLRQQAIDKLWANK